MIPGILHQTWKSQRIPRKLRRYVASWRKHQQLEYRFHSDEQLRNLIACHFPQHLKLYDRFERNIERVDFARYALMFVEGGIYADLDMECLKSLEPLLDFDGPILGTEPVEHTQIYRVDSVICNAILLSPQGHPFWRELLDYIAAVYQPNGSVVYNTGPMALTTFSQQRPELFQAAQIMPPGVFYPLVDERFGGKRQGRFRHVSVHCDLEDAYTAHHWAHTYETWSHCLASVIREFLRGQRKYFREAAEGNFDRRFYRRPLGDNEVRRQLIAAFAEYAALMRASRVNTWLMYGTLLGWYRGQGIIPWDNDIDVGVHYNDLFLMRQICYRHPRYLLEVNPNHIFRAYQKKNMVDARFIDKETGVFIDVFGYHRAFDENFVADKQRNQFLRDDIYPLEPCEFEGITTFRPNNPLGVLHAQYGDCLEPDHTWSGEKWVALEPTLLRAAANSPAS